MSDETPTLPPSAPPTPPGAQPVPPTTPGPAARADRPPPDMPSLMMELARIRREVEGQPEPKKGSLGRTLLLVAVVIASLVWSMLGGPCGPPGGVP